MKRTTLFITLLIVVFSITGLNGQKKTDKPNPMRGVKTLTRSIYVYEEKFGEFIEVLKEKTIHKYDSKGNEVEISNYDSDGNLTNSDDGVSRTIYKYDSNGNLVEDSWYDSEGLVDSKTIYKYDSNGNMVEQSEYNSEGSVTKKDISIYNNKNRLVEEIKYEYEFNFGELREIPKRKTTYEYVEY